MFALIGIVVVLGSVIFGFLLEKGNLSVLFQPAEFVIILGAAFGAFMIGSSPKMLKQVIQNLMGLFKPKAHDKASFVELLSLLHDIFSKIRKEGLISIETDIESPEKSGIFGKYPSVLKNHHAISFICDNLKVIIATNVSPHDLESVMESEVETHHHEAMIPSHLIAKVADALPGLGIVAAVLGVVLAMGKIDQPPSVIGHSIGAALVGTFIGVLLCYGIVGPIASNIENQAKEESKYLQVIQVSVVSFVRGSAPQMAVEFGRRCIPMGERPTFEELEKKVTGRG